jgi:hypothetical protein
MKNVHRPAAYREYELTEGGDVIGVLGFPMTPRMRSSIGSVTVERFLPPMPPTLLVSTVPDPQRYDDLERWLTGQGVEITDRVVTGPIAWVEEGDFGTSGIPVQAIREIAKWLR